MAAEDAEDFDLSSLPEPERPKTPPPTYDSYDTQSGDTLKLRLPSKHVLYGHQARCDANFNDVALIDNLEINAETNFGPSGASTSSHRTPRERVIVVPHTWGQPLPAEALNIDVGLQCDLVFNVSQHEQLLDSTELALSDTGICLVFYAFHRPLKAVEDGQFIDRARARGWQCDEVVTQKNAGLAFPDDVGYEELRGTVHGWRMRLPPRSERMSLQKYNVQ